MNCPDNWRNRKESSFPCPLSLRHPGVPFGVFGWRGIEPKVHWQWEKDGSDHRKEFYQCLI